MKRSDLVLSPGQRLLLLLFTFIICFGIASLAIAFLSKLMSDNLPASLRISAVVQDVVAFILPAIATAMTVTRKSAELLCIPSGISLKTIVLIAAMLILSVPIQENIIYWNYHIELPAALEGIGKMARELEDANARTMNILLGNPSVGAFIVNILIVGVAAGFSEELLFRGCFQRLLTTGGVNPHIAVWTVAFVFSAMHFQFFGFVPRMLLGAYFGYLLIWTGSLWAPVLAHTLNNTAFVVVAWLQARRGLPVDGEPTLYGWPLALASFIFVTAIIYLLYKSRKK